MIVKIRKMKESRVATLEQETRNEHKPAGSWIGACCAKMLGRSHGAHEANGYWSAMKACDCSFPDSQQTCAFLGLTS